MTKPVIVTRAGKGLALSYTELDTNFTNLQNATHNYTAGSTTAQVDLNSALTFTAGTGITLSLNNTTNTLTITGSASGVTSVTGTTGRISSTGGTTPVIDLVASGVTANTYTAPTITVDTYGRITNASNNSVLSFVNITDGSNTVVADGITDTLTLQFTSPITGILTPSTDTIAIGFTSSSLSNRIAQVTTTTNSDNMLYTNAFNRIQRNSQSWSTTSGAHVAYTSTGVINYQNSNVGVTAGYTMSQHIGVTTDITAFTLPAISDGSNTWSRGPNEFYVLFTNATNGNRSITGWSDSPFDLTWIGTNRSTITFSAANQYILLKFTCIYILGTGYNSRYWTGETMMTNIP